MNLAKVTSLYTRDMGFSAKLMGAPLVPLTGSAALPTGSPLDLYLMDPVLFGLPESHPVLTKFHPGLSTTYYLMEIPDGLLRRRDPHDIDEPRKMGLWFDFRNTSHTTASIISFNGRNALAPTNWLEINLDTPSPTVGLPLPRQEWVQVGDKHYPWYNYMQHGSGKQTKDWLDGTPTDVRTMYTPSGEVAQIVFIPTFMQLGVAKQTLHQDSVNDTVTILVFELKPEYKNWRIERNNYAGNWRDHSFNDVLESTPKGNFRGVYRHEESEAIHADAEVAAGGNIKQPIEPPYFAPHMWQAKEALVVYPVRPKTVQELMARNDTNTTIKRV